MEGSPLLHGLAAYSSNPRPDDEIEQAVISGETDVGETEAEGDDEGDAVEPINPHEELKELDQEKLDILAGMQKLSLNCLWKAKWLPAKYLTVVEDDVEEVFNTVNVGGADNAISVEDVHTLCAIVCDKDSSSAALAQEKLLGILEMQGATATCDLERFRELMAKECFKVRLTGWESVYLTIASSVSCRIGNIVSIFIMALIFLSIIGFIVETEPSLKIRTADCPCDPVPLGGPCAPCEPVSSPAFFIIESSCIAVFCVEYLVRLLTVHSVRDQFRFDFTPEFQLPLLEKVPAPPESSRCRKLLKWFSHPLSLVDLLAIVPYFASLIAAEESANLSFLRIIRLFRIFRVFKLADRKSVV